MNTCARIGLQQQTLHKSSRNVSGGGKKKKSKAYGTWGRWTPSRSFHLWLATAGLELALTTLQQPASSAPFHTTLWALEAGHRLRQWDGRLFLENHILCSETCLTFIGTFTFNSRGCDGCRFGYSFLVDLHFWQNFLHWCSCRGKADPALCQTYRDVYKALHKSILI